MLHTIRELMEKAASSEKRTIAVAAAHDKEVLQAVFAARDKGVADAILTGVETRSSSPVRLNRDRVTLMAEGLDGLFPVGEGAGYAGGIVSAAVDGIVAARAALERSEL